MKPIFYWPEWAVWDFIEARKLPYPALYDKGFTRIGCVFCPYIFGKSKNAKAHTMAMQQHYPVLWKRFKAAVFTWFMKKPRPDTFEVYWEKYLSGDLL